MMRTSDHDASDLAGEPVRGRLHRSILLAGLAWLILAALHQPVAPVLATETRRPNRTSTSSQRPGPSTT
jgi:hypothetical protein